MPNKISPIYTRIKQISAQIICSIILIPHRKWELFQYLQDLPLFPNLKYLQFLVNNKFSALSIKLN